ncbi:MAG: WD40 repeat domain-containing protein [Thaumarchaeota archaeon]|nr:WD40 repeat domain-containing protein [Candidatus Calditenuaceae archaeon]MDW8187061.1 WD40 repeat domain-containing protein [Nitrososphaerota archaeon]
MGRATLVVLIVVLIVGAIIALNYTPAGQLLGLVTTVSPTRTTHVTTPQQTHTTPTVPLTTTPAQTITTTVATTTPDSEAEIVDAEIVNPARFYIASYGQLYIYDHSRGRLESVLQRRISCFDFDPNDPRKLYYTDANNVEIRLFTSESGEKTVYRHDTYVRCVRFGRDGMLYFSEASGAGADGKIFRLRGESAELFYVVKLRDVDGFWAGDFDFNERGDLYLASGNRIPSSIYFVVNQVPTRIKTIDSSIVGLRLVKQVTLKIGGVTTILARGLLYTDFHNSLYIYDLTTGKTYRFYHNASFTYDNRLQDALLAQ